MQGRNFFSGIGRWLFGGGTLEYKCRALVILLAGVLLVVNPDQTLKGVSLGFAILLALLAFGLLYRQWRVHKTWLNYLGIGICMAAGLTIWLLNDLTMLRVALWLLAALWIGSIIGVMRKIIAGVKLGVPSLALWLIMAAFLLGAGYLVWLPGGTLSRDLWWLSWLMIAVGIFMLLLKYDGPTKKER